MDNSKINIPIWQKATMTVNEAAAYSSIGVNKIYEFTNNPLCSFVLFIGDKKRLIKRREFEKFLEQNIEI